MNRWDLLVAFIIVYTCVQHGPGAAVCAIAVVYLLMPNAPQPRR